MLQITLCLDKPALAPYCKKCGKLVSEAFFLYRAVDRDQVLAAGLFEVFSESVQIVHYEESGDGDPFLLDGILRAGLNYASSFGIDRGCIPEVLRYTHRRLFNKLNYPPQPEFGISNFFQKYKNCRPGI